MAKFEIKITTPTDVSGAEKATRELDKLGKVTQTTGVATERLTQSKSRLLDGLKKLGGQIPIVGTALNALKNPYTAIAAAAGIALSAIRKLNEDIDRFASAAGKFENLSTAGRTVASIFREAAGRSLEFNTALRQLEGRADTASEKLAQLRRNIARAAGIEDELAPADETQEDKRARRQRRIASEIGAVGDARITAQNDLREARAALPGATRARAEAEARLNQFKKLNAANESAIGELGGRSALVKRIADLTPFADQGNRSAQLQLALARSALEDYDRTRAAVQPRLEPLQTKLNLATTEEQRIQGRITGGVETLRGFGVAQADLEADLSAQRNAFGAAQLGPRFATVQESAQWEARRGEIAAQWERLIAIQERMLQRMENNERRSGGQSQQ